MVGYGNDPLLLFPVIARHEIHVRLPLGHQEGGRHLYSSIVRQIGPLTVIIGAGRLIDPFGYGPAHDRAPVMVIDPFYIRVTVLQAGPCVVTQVKTADNDGYDAVQVGFMDKRENLVNKPMKGQFDKAGVSCKRFVKEFKFENASEYQLAQEIKADVFENGEKVDVTAISKGKGFQGAIKRHGMHRGPMTHGSKYHRHAGSNGSASDPSKVFKGKKMPGCGCHICL